MKILAPALILLFIAFGCGGSKNAQETKSEPPTNAAPTKGNPCKLTEAECKYLGALLGYLSSMHEQDQELATTMDGARTGQSTLGEIKKKLEKTQTLEQAAFFGDYHSAKPAPGYADIDQRVQALHKKYVAV